MQGPSSFLQVVANQVIIFGPGDGVFVYNGTPALGNPPVISITEAADDPFGNPVSGGVVVGLNTKVQIQLQSNGGVGQLIVQLNDPSFTNPLVEGAVIGNFADLVINGPANTATGFKDFVGIEFNSSDGISSLANMQFVYTNTSGGAAVLGSYNGNGWALGTTSIATLSVGSGATISGGLSTDSLTVNGSGSTQGASTTTTSTNGLPNGGIQGTSGSASAGTAHTHGPGNYSVVNGQHSHTLVHTHPF